MSVPTLYVFAISHYCEKARWGLDYLGVSYELEYLAPGAHAAVVQGLGAEGSSLPVLVSDGTVVQGSSAILDWAEAAAGDTTKTLQPDSESDAWRALEERLDDIAGVHVRRYYYSEAILEHPDTVRPIFERDLVGAQREALAASWKFVPAAMAQRMDLGAEQQKDSRRIVEKELDWLDAQLAGGRRFLIGDRFSRVDLTAASLLAPLAAPPEHPAYSALAVPPRVEADLAAWASRPSAAWVGEIYRKYR